MKIHVAGVQDLPAPADEAQQELLSVVWEHFSMTFEWPQFEYVDRRLDQSGMDAVAALQNMPTGLIQGFPDMFRREPSDDAMLPLTIAGAARCPGSADLVQLFVSLIRRLAETEKLWPAGPGRERPALTSAEVASDFGLPPSMAAQELRLAFLIARSEPGVTGSSSPQDDPSAWTLRADRRIRPFRAVPDIGAYWRIRSALMAPPSTPVIDTAPDSPPAPADGAELSTFSLNCELHPAITTASAELYRDGYLGQAVMQAFRTVEHRVQMLTGSAESGKKLMGQAFGGDSPALHVTRSTSTGSLRSEREGFRDLFTGAVAALRNVHAHGEHFDEDPAEAIEMLASPAS